MFKKGILFVVALVTALVLSFSSVDKMTFAAGDMSSTPITAYIEPECC